jgi:hypothetical protein
MITLFNHVALKLQFFRKYIAVIIVLIIANIIYRLAFLTQAELYNHSITMLNLLCLAWLALLNFMLHAFVKSPVDCSQKNSLLIRVKNKLHQYIEYFLTVLFIGLTFTVVILSVKMLKLYAT